ncbi:MAG: epoxyqueuosine reductase [Symbiobacteriaceae bacterium]|nr:epoxyqueuosine reductase [Symbiobacteriaceae bacterium]
MDLYREIVTLITDEVLSAEAATRFRPPLVGVAAAEDPLFPQLKSIVGEHHLLPQDLLPEAKSVLAFFLPFAAPIVDSNRGEEVSREWAEIYLQGNALINAICSQLAAMLQEKGVATAILPATHNYDATTLQAPWSHRSVAFIAGLGRFGVNRMLISPQGCAGRYGSLITSADLVATPRPSEATADEPCGYLRDGSCGYCLAHCPTQALTPQGINRHRCNDYLLQVSQRFAALGFCDVCGKCAVGPCAVR